MYVFIESAEGQSMLQSIRVDSICSDTLKTRASPAFPENACLPYKKLHLKNPQQTFDKLNLSITAFIDLISTVVIGHLGASNFVIRAVKTQARS